jgi:hypothetical protein
LFQVFGLSCWRVSAGLRSSWLTFHLTGRKFGRAGFCSLH